MDTGTHLEVVLNISEELNAIRKRANLAHLKLHTQENLLVWTHSLRVLVVSTNRLPVEGFPSFGWAKLRLDKRVESIIEFLENHLLPLSGEDPPTLTGH
jgi:hypothetical protein